MRSQPRIRTEKGRGTHCLQGVLPALLPFPYTSRAAAGPARFIFLLLCTARRRPLQAGPARKHPQSLPAWRKAASSSPVVLRHPAALFSSMRRIMRIIVLCTRPSFSKQKAPRRQNSRPGARLCRGPRPRCTCRSISSRTRLLLQSGPAHSKQNTSLPEKYFFALQSPATPPHTGRRHIRYAWRGARPAHPLPPAQSRAHPAPRPAPGHIAPVAP